MVTKPAGHQASGVPAHGQRTATPKARGIEPLIQSQADLAAHARHGPLLIQRGAGCRVWDTDGREYIDAGAGLSCVSLGYGEERLMEAARRQLLELPFFHTFSHWGHAQAVELADKLLPLAPPGLTNILFQCSGSEANDAAVKLAWLYWAAQGQPARRTIISLERSYHGSTVATASLSGQPGMHAGFGLPLPGFISAESPNFDRFHEDGESEESYSLRLAQSLDELIQAEGPGTIAAFFADPIQGGGGVIPPPRGYFAAIQAVLRRHGILFVVDEVTSGFGRTGCMWACEAFGLQPDMLTCAKQMSSGYQPISALLVSGQVHAAMMEMSQRHGTFGHGYTYGGHPVACAVALETLQLYAERDIVGRVRAVAPGFLHGLAALGDHPLVGNVRGIGLAAGVELMRNRAERLPFPASIGAGARVQAACLSAGLIVRAVGDRIAFTPPLIVAESDLAAIHQRFGDALDATWTELRRAGLIAA